jgi:hypothetical protein
VLSRRVLNRTLLARQHLLERSAMPPLAMVEHLVGLQAQEPLPPYLSLWSRLTDPDPAAVSAALEERTAVRLVLMRGTLHLVTADDALRLRPLVQPLLDRSRRQQSARPAADVDSSALAAATRAELVAGPVELSALGDLLTVTFPDVPAAALAQAARLTVPLVQCPPRGTWGGSGRVMHQTLEAWLERDLEAPDPAWVVRRYLRAFGPASAADLTTWSGVADLRRALGDLADELRRDRDEDGRELVDLEELPLADEDTPAPVRLLGRYDNLWLSHEQRDRVTPPGTRPRWMGVNGGVAATVFVDGQLQGLWRRTPSGGVDVELFRALTTEEQDGLDAEVAALEVFLAG